MKRCKNKIITPIAKLSIALFKIVCYWKTINFILNNGKEIWVENKMNKAHLTVWKISHSKTTCSIKIGRLGHKRNIVCDCPFKAATMEMRYVQV